MDSKQVSEVRNKRGKSHGTWFGNLKKYIYEKFTTTVLKQNRKKRKSHKNPRGHNA